MWVLFTGLPFVRALFWHKLCAYLSVLVGDWHGFLSDEWNASGLVLTGTMAALCLFSLWFICRRIFEAFYRFHWILFLVVIGSAFIHGAGGIAFGAAPWLFDILVRLLISFLNNNHQRSILAVRLPSNVVRLTFLKRDFKYKSGQYCFICVPGVSLFEWHPFSLSSSPHENMHQSCESLSCELVWSHDLLSFLHCKNCWDFPRHLAKHNGWLLEC